MVEPHGAGNDSRRKPVAGAEGCFLHTQSLRDTCSTCQSPGEHGVGMEKRDYLPEMFSEVDIAAMKSLRQSIDSKELSNRGKMFPGGEAPSLSFHGPHPLEREGKLSRE